MKRAISIFALCLLLAGCASTSPQADPRDPAVIRNMPRATYPTPR